MKLWIVGKFTGQTVDDKEWEFQGVFDSKALALAACEGHPLYFVGPVLLNDVRPDETEKNWVGAFYPAAGGDSR